MFSTPLICSSIGVTTVEDTTSALAPGYWPVTLIKGGAISGYWAIGRRKNDTEPRMTKMIETTAAKIGRSMKKCEMRMRQGSRFRSSYTDAAPSFANFGIERTLANYSSSVAFGSEVRMKRSWQ